MDNEKKPCCCCGTPAQPEAATAPAVDAPAVPTESVTPSCCRHKDRTPEEHKALLNRLSRIEGQVRGIRGMLEKDAYCVDILVQVAAANSALNSFSKELLAQHISTCVADDLRAGSEAKLDELVKKYDCLAARRGKGFMQGLVVTGRPVGEVINRAIENGLLVISAGSDVLRMVPPLVITKDDIDEMIEKLEKALQ